MSTFQPATDTITLPASAVLYFALKRSFHFIAMSFGVAIALYTSTHGKPVHHPAPPAIAGVEIDGDIGAFALMLFGVFLLLVALQMAYNYFLVNSYSIQMRKDGLALHYGVFNTSNEVVLFSRIQDIIINCSILERLMGLSTLTVQNAAGKPEVISGLEADTAATLREQILERVGRSSPT